MVRIVLGQDSEKKLKQISLWNDNVQERISDLAEETKQGTVISEVENAQFGLQYWCFCLLSASDVLQIHYK